MSKKLQKTFDEEGNSHAFKYKEERFP